MFLFLSKCAIKNTRYDVDINYTSDFNIIKSYIKITYLFIGV